MKKSIFLLAAVATMLAACTKSYDAPKAKLNKADFQKEIDGKQNNLYILTNANGMEVTMMNFGARIVSICVPDKDGNFGDVVLGFDNIQPYLDNQTDFGAFIGRYGNRINKGQFTLDGVDYQLSTNNFGHSLHGGVKGFQYCMFDIEQISDNQLVASYTAADGEMGFPGTLVAKATYTLTDCNAIIIEYEATTDKPTIVNLTNHSYFNLSGNARSILDHALMVNACGFTPVDETYMTTGEIAPVCGTPMDFRRPTRIGERIDNFEFEQLKNGNGYDHNWVLNTKCPKELACLLIDPQSGRTMEVYTNEPGVQVYTGNFLDGTLTGKNGIVYKKRAAICLETQHFPDTPNKPEWPSCVLRPGETYKSICAYKFGVCQEKCGECKEGACEKKHGECKEGACEKKHGECKEGACEKKHGECKEGACEKKHGECKEGACEKKHGECKEGACEKKHGECKEGACEKPCDKKCDKACDKKCDKACDKACDKKCEKDCDKACDKKCEKDCDKACEKECK